MNKSSLIEAISPEIDEQALVKIVSKQKGILLSNSSELQLKLFDVDSVVHLSEFDLIESRLTENENKLLFMEKIKLIFGVDSLISFISKLITVLSFEKFFSIFDITSNIKLYGFYSLNIFKPVEILVKQIRNDLFIIKSFKSFNNMELKREHDFHLPYKEFKRLNLNNGNLVVIKILFKNDQQSIDANIIEPILDKIEMLHLSLENESKLKPFNDLIDKAETNLSYLKFGVNRGTFKKVPTVKSSLDFLKLVSIDNLDFLNDLSTVKSLDVFFDNWELRKNCDIKFQKNLIIDFNINQMSYHLKTLNIFHTYIDSKHLSNLKYFPNLTNSKISYVILANNGFDLSECKMLQELKIHFTNDSLVKSPATNHDNIKWPTNLKKLSITIHNIKNLSQDYSIRLDILQKLSTSGPKSITDLCVDISYDTGGSGPELYNFTKEDISKVSGYLNGLMSDGIEVLKLKGISRYNYKIGKPLIFSSLQLPASLKLLSLNDFILDYSYAKLNNLKKIFLEHSLFDSEFKLPFADEIVIEKCTFKDLNYLPMGCSKILFKMCTFRKVPGYDGDVRNVIIQNSRLMDNSDSGASFGTSNVFGKLDSYNSGNKSSSNRVDANLLESSFSSLNLNPAMIQSSTMRTSSNESILSENDVLKPRSSSLNDLEKINGHSKSNGDGTTSASYFANDYYNQDYKYGTPQMSYDGRNNQFNLSQHQTQYNQNNFGGDQFPRKIINPVLYNDNQHQQQFQNEYLYESHSPVSSSGSSTSSTNMNNYNNGSSYNMMSNTNKDTNEMKYDNTNNYNYNNFNASQVNNIYNTQYQSGQTQYGHDKQQQRQLHQQLQQQHSQFNQPLSVQQQLQQLNLQQQMMMMGLSKQYGSDYTGSSTGAGAGSGGRY
ncbi:hypothetical protein CANARDRAFT_25117 [[Candida] arabinofermentans NRRL YB-2248]|uniref:Uncharacterized protein n=1 Tax=[Candida] arabinofermentans NRRL YB-2248 TaxID=983967 RepID=A0A1E4SUY9_9ASCO|nr:hypothetical protein CANARDRAFT_25117 [[Candida] arabinofermentans NRRL YB-2248]